MKTNTLQFKTKLEKQMYPMLIKRIQKREVFVRRDVKTKTESLRKVER